MKKSSSSKTIFGIIFYMLLLFSTTMAESLPNKSRASQLVALTGDQDYADEESAWDRTYARKDYVFGREAAELLKNHVEILPKGRALDIAMGEGRNAVYLAKKGFAVEGVDISTVGIRKAQDLASANGVRIQTTNADLKQYKIKPNTYSVILNFYYLQKNLYAQIKAGLKHGGVIVFETYTKDQIKNGTNSGWEKDFLLEPGELKKAFSDFEVLYYRESNDGVNAIASLIARKR